MCRCGVLESDYATKPRFIENFWKAFLRTLPKDHIIVEDDRKATAGKGEGDSREGGGNGGGGGELPAGFLVCDFSPIKEYLDKQKALKKEMTKEEKEVGCISFHTPTFLTDRSWKEGLFDCCHPDLDACACVEKHVFQGYIKQGGRSSFFFFPSFPTSVQIYMEIV